MRQPRLKVGEYVRCEMNGTQRLLRVASCDIKLSTASSRAFSAKQMLPKPSNLLVFVTQTYGEKAVIQGMSEQEVELVDPFEAQLLILQGANE